ncbi:WD repeat domain phosphoinositide-interacting protein 4 [Biomphalaria glabrata]|uniref:WD repeat domain phosphoinositide-interacting protein 4-like n=3 Tax=Biomphalaria TaxID=6525 RepID=A0A2C9KH43_BIOGL|nr:WD repeat domain phosphoinositide-interacting protein 4-like [Biomphalaria glabrata]KAI8765301.1 WD repeat domain phosphoinositide-interacting protein 4-like [Biomphalaria glabrata]KAI8797279.1 WD repeat domain phosphoinositide-interacting protein 4 [Biomphalaria glabrata]KAK0049074.1 WD repeat domain phosphoinositide-interacting protein 4 [Biomphalaria pfeifferi]
MHIMARRGVLSAKLNQTQEYFTCATEDGLRIFHMDPLVQINFVDASKIGSIRIAEMRFRSNIVAIVSGGSRPLFDDRTVILWDLQKETAVSKIVVKEPVLDVKMTNDRLLVILRSRIILLSFPNGETLSEICTRDNPNAVCAVAHHARKLVFPSKKSRGSIQIEELDKDDSAPESKPPSIVQAHSNDIICAAINSAGDCIATASTQGTNIHLYNVHTKVITKLRRGLDKANIYCLNFSKDSSYLSCSSDKGTVHVWSLKDPEMNPVSTLKPLVGLPSEVKSYASFTVTAECACLCSFGVGDAMFAICMDGSFHKYKLGRDGSQTETGRNCFRVSYDIYPNLGELYD